PGEQPKHWTKALIKAESEKYPTVVAVSLTLAFVSVKRSCACNILNWSKAYSLFPIGPGK
ncbi:MAG: hypothetical protein AAGE79_02570, partial [Acinetobacter pittii]